MRGQHFFIHLEIGDFSKADPVRGLSLTCGRIMRMRLAPLAIAFALTLARQAVVDDGPVGIGVWYAGPAARPPAPTTSDVERLRDDLSSIRRAGFNAITTWTSWREAEPQRGAYALAALERLIAAAAEADLRVLVVAYTEPAPTWAAGDRDGAARFVSYVSKRLSLQTNVIAVSSTAGVSDGVPSRIEVDAGGALDARLAMWSELAGGARYLAFAGTDGPLSPAILSLGETAGVVTRNQALFAPLRPRTGGVLRISGGDARSRVEVRLLESPDAIVIIGLNPEAAPRKVTIAFSPEMPEAIWQNLETGTSVSFIMTKEGPSFEHLFGPRDALVLMIRKRLR
jgi:glycosyl hydrolase family 42 (putative beta-galactosidase)